MEQRHSHVPLLCINWIIHSIQWARSGIIEILNAAKEYACGIKIQFINGAQESRRAEQSLRQLAAQIAKLWMLRHHRMVYIVNGVDGILRNAARFFLLTLTYLSSLFLHAYLHALAGSCFSITCHAMWCNS